MWGSGPDDVWAVGNSGQLGHWDGTSWTISTTATERHLYSVWGTGPDDVWVTGAGSEILHYDGGSWTVDHNDQVLLIHDVWGAGSQHVIAVGEKGRVLRHDGSTWHAESGGLYDLDRVHDLWGASANAVWAATDGGLVQYDGSSWSYVTHDETHAVWGFDAGDIWTVDEDGGLHHGDGSSWSPVATPFDTTSIGGIEGLWGAAPSDLWITAGHEIAHWDGSSFTTTPSGLAPGEATLTSVHGCSSDDVWVVGTGGTILHWSGAAWAPSTNSIVANLTDVWCAGAGDVWAVGDKEVHHYDGGGWSLAHSGLRDFHAVAADGAGHVWAAGEAGHVARWDGSQWTQPDSETYLPLSTLWVGDGVLFAGGQAAAILRHEL